MKKKFKRDLSSLESIFTFIKNFVNRNSIDESLSYLINLAIEELFTNMVKYNSQNPNPILIQLSKEKNTLVVSMTEFDTEPFDIKKARSYDHNQSLKDRPIGGLGIHLVKNMVDTIEYTYENRNSTITLVKRLRKAYV
jgi:anti-sigma regulatory factor (Ser/Thr protein kinase)